MGRMGRGEMELRRWRLKSWDKWYSAGKGFYMRRDDTRGQRGGEGVHSHVYLTLHLRFTSLLVL